MLALLSREVNNAVYSHPTLISNECGRSTLVPRASRIFDMIMDCNVRFAP